MWFEYTHENCNLEGTLLYLEKEQSLYYEPWEKSDFSIMLGAAYTGLDVQSSTGKVVQISGLNPKKTWIEKTLCFPNACEGTLVFKKETPLLRGTAVDYAMGLHTFYDRERSCICIGNVVTDDQYKRVEFCKGVVAVLDKKRLLAIWAKIILI